MKQTYQGQSVFITGASAGIGAALAEAFAQQGARVALAARRMEKIESLARRIESAGGKSLAVACDVTSRASLDAAVKTVVEAFGGIDVVVANAGFGVSGPFEKLQTGDYRRQFDTNFFGVLDTIYAVLPHLAVSKGRLGIVSSVMGRMASPSASAYCSSKFALCGLAESLYYELAERGISVTCIEPGLVATEFRKVDNEGNFHADAPDPAPNWLAISPQQAAKTILHGLEKRRFEVVVSGHGKLLLLFSRHLPWLFRAVLRWHTRGKLDDFEKQRRGPINP